MSPFKGRQGTFKVFWPSLRFCCIGKSLLCSLLLLTHVNANTAGFPFFRDSSFCFSVLPSGLLHYIWMPMLLTFPPWSSGLPSLSVDLHQLQMKKTLRSHKVTTPLVCSCFTHINPTTVHLVWLESAPATKEPDYAPLPNRHIKLHTICI